MLKPATEQPETQVLPEPELEKRSRRRFSTEFKLRVIARADACQYGELGELLRSEGLYSGQLQQWRKELAAGGENGLGKTKPGPGADHGGVSMRSFLEVYARARANTTEEPDAGKRHVRVCAGGTG